MISSFIGIRPLFQSTLPAGGATPHSRAEEPAKRFQSTLPAGGATVYKPRVKVCLCISIHTPRRGSDEIQRGNLESPDNFNPHSPQGERPPGTRLSSMFMIFQSTLPAGGATLSRREQKCMYSDFNPHSPQGERPRSSSIGRRCKYFNPHSPQGERPKYAELSKIQQEFQSTLPAGGATFFSLVFLVSRAISIHTPRRGSD